jgi:hypothetical protein
MVNLEIDKRLESLIRVFNTRYSKSNDKDTLLKREREAHELLFDEKKLPLWTNVFSNNRPLKYLDLNSYTDLDIVSIREAYHKYIVNGADINEAGELYKDRNGLYNRRPPTALQIHYYIEAKTRFSYLMWLKKEYSFSENEKGNYVLKNESVILKLLEVYKKDYFPDEDKKVWKQRWINGNNTLPKIKIDNFKNGNNKHLLLTILNVAHPFMKVKKIEDYIKRRWGLKSYHSDISKYINNTLRNQKVTEHPEKENIIEILKPEQN